MEALFSRQVVESERVADVRRDFIDMEARRREFEVSLLQAELRQRATREAVDRGGAQQQLSVEREVAMIDDEVTAAERALLTSSSAAAAMNAVLSRDSSLTYRIVRSGAGSTQTLSAEESDVLEPGDVLKVVTGPAPDKLSQAASGVGTASEDQALAR